MFAQNRALAEARELLKDGMERDRLQEQRPVGCICLGFGALPDEEFCGCPDGVALEAETTERIRKQVARDVVEFTRRAGIPFRNRDHTLDSYPGEVPEEIRKWKPFEGIFIGGETGRGKTGLAVGLLKKGIAFSAAAGLFVTVPELLDSLRDTYRKDADSSEGEVMARLKRVPLLVLDDLGTEKASDWVEEKLYVLINHRYAEELPTIYTSNLSLRDLGAKWHERIAWRIQESATVVTLKGPNLRAKK